MIVQVQLVRNGYDEAGRLIYSWGKLGSTSHSLNMTFDGFGRRTSLSHSNGLGGTYGFDSMDRVNSISWSGAGASMSEALSYSSAGLINQVTRGDQSLTIGYSAKNELSSVSYSGSESLPSSYVNTSLTQDASGNISTYRGQTFSKFNNFVTAIGTDVYWPDYSGLGQMAGTFFNRRHIGQIAELLSGW